MNERESQEQVHQAAPGTSVPAAYENQPSVTKPMNEGDRELLEKAAKAAGARWSDFSDRTPDCYQIQHADGIWREWNPLTDDGDAFRLAVRLKICIEFGHCLDDAPVVRCGPEWERENWPEHANFPDPRAATRRAIVRAAAEIGEALP
jgi:hypothetical protein